MMRRGGIPFSWTTRRMSRHKTTILLAIVLAETLCLVSVYYRLLNTTGHTSPVSKVVTAGSVAQLALPSVAPRVVYSCPNGTFSKNISDPLIFIGGIPSSGTTLMRVMMDAHPDIRCGEETRIVPRLLFMRSRMLDSKVEAERLVEAGITESLVDSAFKKMIETFIVGHGKPAQYLCNKDPLALRSMEVLRRMFPSAKFILMIRDGRATTNSIIKRGVTISGVDITSADKVMTFWQDALGSMLRMCKNLGESCLEVYYEQLVLDPKEEMRQVLDFLSIPWHDNVLQHHKLVRNASEISISK